MTQTKELVTNEVHLCLEDLLKNLGIHNYVIDISAGTIKGDNFLGIIAKAQVKGETAEGKKISRSFIVKSAPQNETFRTSAPVRKAYDREIYMYKKVLPAFNKLQNDKGVKAPFKSFAKFYDSSMNNMHEALIMENMKEYGFDLHDRRQPLNYKHAVLVLREYGKLHALSFALRDQNPRLFQELAENTQESFFCNMGDDDMHNSFRSQSDKALNALDPVKHRSAYEKFKKFQDHMVDDINKAVKSDLTSPYAVIGHGDCWINNFLFKYDDSIKVEAPTEMCFLDWQLARLGSPALDLGYFIFTGTDKQLRDKYYDKLIEEYYSSFSQFLRELGGNPEKSMPFEVLQEHLKQYSVYGLYMAVLVLLIIISDGDEIPDIHNLEKGENMMEKFKYEPKNAELYNSRIRGVILDFDRLGYHF